MDRAELEEKYGAVYDTAELQKKFKVLGFMAPYCVVQEIETGAKGSLQFQHDPRLYFNFMLD